MAKFFVVSALVVGSWFYAPLVVVDGWRWFVVPLGAPAVAYWQAFGLLSLVGLMCGNGALADAGEIKARETVEMVVYAWLRPAMPHLVMWLVSP